MNFDRGRYRGLQYYKLKHSSRGVPHTSDLKGKAKCLENYLREALFLRTATSNTKEDKPQSHWGQRGSFSVKNDLYLSMATSL